MGDKRFEWDWVAYSADSMSHGLKDLEAPSSTISIAQGFPTRVATVNTYTSLTWTTYNLSQSRVQNTKQHRELKNALKGHGIYRVLLLEIQRKATSDRK